MYVVAAISRETTIAWDAVYSIQLHAINRETTIAWDAVYSGYVYTTMAKLNFFYMI